MQLLRALRPIVRPLFFLTPSVIEHYPENKTDLVTCIRRKRCARFKENISFHVPLLPPLHTRTICPPT